jgi:O-antigen ligase
MLPQMRLEVADRRAVALIGTGFALSAVVLGVGSVVSPPLALAAAAAALFTTIAFRNLAAGLALFTLLTFFDRATTLTGGGPSPVKLAGLALAVAWAMIAVNRLSRVPMLSREYPLFAFGILAIAGWCFVSALWAPDSALAISTAFRLALSVVLVFIVFSALREPSHVRWIMWAFVLGVLMAQSIAFLGLYPSEEGRISGGFNDPNELGSVDVVGLALAAFAFFAFRGRRIRWIFLPIGVFFVVGLLDTQSQAGIVALGVVLILGVAFAGRARGRAAAIVASLLLIGTVYYAFLAPPTLLETITSSENVGARESLWTVAEQAVKDHPILGIGAGNFIRVAPTYTVGDLNLPRFDSILSGHVVHNTYLEVLTELGPLGLLMFLGLIAVSFALGVRAVRQFERAGYWELEMLTRGFLIGMAGMLVASTFATATYEKQLWLLIALGPALAGLAARAPVVSPERAKPPRGEPDSLPAPGAGTRRGPR